jgi:hypothetical protein
VKSPKSVVPIVCIAAAVAAAGCGSSSDSHPSSSGTSSTPAVKSLSTTAYTRAADKICRDTAKKAPPFPGEKDKSGGYKTTAAKVIPYLQTIRSLENKSLQRLSHLQPPAAQKNKVEAMMAAKRQRLQGLDEAIQAAQRGDGAAFTAAFQRDQKTNGPRYVQAAAALGLKGCSL